MALLYRSVVSTEPANLLDDVRRDFSDWLTNSNLSSDLHQEGYQLDGALLVHSSSALDRRCVSFRFDEGEGEERVRTTLFAGTAADSGWILVEVEAPEAIPASPRQLEQVPAFVRALLERGAASGERATSISAFERRRPVGEIASWIRTAALPVVLFVDDGSEPAANSAVIDEVIRRTLGMVIPIRLSLASAADLGDELPELTSLRSGSVSYIAPSLADGGLQRTDIPRTVAHTQPVAVARDVQRRALAYAVVSGLPALLTEDLLRLPGMPNGPSVYEGEAFDLLEDVIAERDLARRDLAVLQSDHEDVVLEFDELLEELDTFRRRASFLERRLAELGDFAAVILDEEPLPTDVNSCLEVVDLARAYLSHLALEIDIRPTRELENQARTPLWAKIAWQAMQAMQDYAARKFDHSFLGDFLEFCADPPAGAVSFMAGRVALNESESTNASSECRRVRTFPVPKTVDSSGNIYMAAHIKIAPRGSPAPRIHYFDDTGNGRTGKIYLGYFGQHLVTGT